MPVADPEDVKNQPPPPGGRRACRAGQIDEDASSIRVRARSRPRLLPAAQGVCRPTSSPAEVGAVDRASGLFVDLSYYRNLSLQELR